MSVDPPPLSTDRHDVLHADGGQDPIHILLWTAATQRPVEEVAALIRLLNRGGDVTSPVGEALRAAAVARPLDEVRHLVTLLGEGPLDIGEAGTALRAAAVGRPVEEVAELVSILGAGGTPTAPVDPLPDLNDTSGGGTTADPVPGNGQGAPAALLAPVDPLPDVSDSTHSAEGDGWPACDLRAGAKKSLVLAAYGVPLGLTLSLPATAHGNGGSLTRVGSAVLRSLPRWTAAAALVACGALHLPADVSGLRHAGYGDVLSLAVAALCLVFGLWLAVQESTGTWAAAAATCAGVLAAYSLSGFGTVDILANTLGEGVAWAKATAVCCAALAVVLAAATLVRRQRPAGLTTGG